MQAKPNETSLMDVEREHVLEAIQSSRECLDALERAVKDDDAVLERLYAFSARATTLAIRCSRLETVATFDAEPEPVGCEHAWVDGPALAAGPAWHYCVFCGVVQRTAEVPR